MEKNNNVKSINNLGKWVDVSCAFDPSEASNENTIKAKIWMRRTWTATNTVCELNEEEAPPTEVVLNTLFRIFFSFHLILVWLFIIISLLNTRIRFKWISIRIIYIEYEHEKGIFSPNMEYWTLKCQSIISVGWWFCRMHVNVSAHSMYCNTYSQTNIPSYTWMVNFSKWCHLEFVFCVGYIKYAPFTIVRSTHFKMGWTSV